MVLWKLRINLRILHAFRWILYPQCIFVEYREYTDGFCYHDAVQNQIIVNARFSISLHNTLIADRKSIEAEKKLELKHSWGG